ncbi:MAG: hypothetical protein KAI26_01915 [Nanoarchaeota archaeon]|nr:hypothetical protein [Nanoarchaeota archaeon]
MTFIRVKIIKGKQYAYLIKNKWLKTKKMPKQKVVGYLGSVITPHIKETMADASFFDFYNIYEPEDYLGDKSRDTILKDLVKFELVRHDTGSKKIRFDTGTFTLTSSNRGIVLKINEGFLCTHTIQSLKDFDARGDEEDIGIALAKAFVNAGIAVPKDIFIGYFYQCRKGIIH